MAESLESFKSYIGKSETATDVVTASAMVKFAATLGLENPPLEKGSPIPPGWYGGFLPASHRPNKMREDGQASGGGFMRRSALMIAVKPLFHSHYPDAAEWRMRVDAQGRRRN